MSRVPGLVGGLALILLTAADLGAAPTRGTILSGAALAERGAIIELHFDIRGPRPRWRLDSGRQQLAIILDHTRLGIPQAPLAGLEHPPVTAVRATQTAAGAAQLTVAVSGKVDFAVAFAPHELIARFARAGTAPDIAAPAVIAAERVRPPASRMRDGSSMPAIAPPGPIMTNSAQSRATAASTISANSSPGLPVAQPVSIQVPAPRPPRPALIVIDPGHGGRDPGTLSAGGIAEKDLALQIATRLQRALVARGVNARLTRADDRFLSLAARTQAANRNAADLFISIHLNSSPEPATSGVATYYLNNTTDRATIRLARIENGVMGGYQDSTIPDLHYILADLRQGDKANESVALSRMIEADSVAAAGAALGVRVDDLGARQGPFYVLVGAEMPAVLVECGFLSNPLEAERLGDPRYQQGLADGIAAAVVHYFNNDAAVGNL